MRASRARKAGVGGRTSAGPWSFGPSWRLGKSILAATGLHFRNVVRGSRRWGMGDLQPVPDKAEDNTKMDQAGGRGCERGESNSHALSGTGS